MLVLWATCRSPLQVCFHCWPSTTAKGTPIHRKPPSCLVGLPSALSGAALLTGLRNLDFLYHLRSHLFSPHILLLHPVLLPQNHEVSADVSLGFGFEHLFLNGLVVLTLVRQIFTLLPPRSLTEATCLVVVFAAFPRSHLNLQFKASFELSLDNGPLKSDRNDRSSPPPPPKSTCVCMCAHNFSVSLFQSFA